MLLSQWHALRHHTSERLPYFGAKHSPLHFNQHFNAFRCTFCTLAAHAVITSACLLVHSHNALLLLTTSVSHHAPCNMVVQVRGHAYIPFPRGYCATPQVLCFRCVSGMRMYVRLFVFNTIPPCPRKHPHRHQSVKGTQGARKSCTQLQQPEQRPAESNGCASREGDQTREFTQFHCL